MIPDANSELTTLRLLSARLGRNSLLAQAATGNTSIKCDGTLWIKASGKWLADADENGAFVPVDLGAARASISLRRNPTCGARGASVETAMHALIPHRVVLHMHSVNAIAWAVRRDQAELAERMEGLRWQWARYCASGLDLALEIAKTPEADVFVLANHGLVVCGADCDSAESLLWEVERRLRIEPRAAAPVAGSLCESGLWRLPSDRVIHGLATDATSRKILEGGILFPCQAIFLGSDDFRMVDGEGVLIHRRAGAVVEATLAGLAEVLRRVNAREAVRYLTDGEVENLRSADVYRYRRLVKSGKPTANSPRSELISVEI